MDTVKKLIQHVSRGFCDLRGVLVLDALLIHSVLTDDELSQLLGIQRKDLRGVCAKLKEDHLVTDHVQKEEGPGLRPISKTYYYIHYTETIDAIKWKMHTIVNRLKEQTGNEAQPQGYVCDTCKARYSTIEAVSLFSPDRNAFICEVCGSVLREDDTSAQSQATQDRLGFLMTQIQPIIDALQTVDDMVVPENTFQSSLADAVPPPTQAAIPGLGPLGGRPGEGPQSIAADARGALPTAKSRPGDLVAAPLRVSITSSEETAERERQQKEERTRLAEENALPTWHVESTVGKSLTDSSQQEGVATTASANAGNASSTAIKTEDAAIEGDQAQTTEEQRANEETLAAYYAELAKKQAEEDEDEDEEDDEDEFEDVGVSAPFNVEEEDLDEDED